MHKNIVTLLALCTAYVITSMEMPLSEDEKLFLQSSVRGTVKEINRYIAAGVSINTHDQFGENALFKAVYHGNWRIANFLMKKGIRINHHPHNYGNNTTYLHLLVCENTTREDESAAYFLLDYALNVHKADPNPLDKYGDTPLDKAYYRKNNACIQLLKKYGGVRKVRTIEP